MLVRAAGLDRVGLPGPERGRLAVAADAAYRAHPRGPPLAGGGRRHALGTGLRHPRRRGGPAGGTGGGPPVPAARPSPQPPHGWSTPPGQPVSAGTELAAPDAGPWVSVASPVAYPRTLASATA